MSNGQAARGKGQAYFLAFWAPLIVAAVMVPVIWGLAYWKLGPIDPAPGKRGSDGSWFVPAAVVGTLIAVVAGVYTAMKQSYLLRNGTRVIGRFAAHGSPIGEMMKVTCEYQVGGQTYSQSATEPPALLEALKLGDPMVLYVDPRKPSRAYAIWGPIE